MVVKQKMYKLEYQTVQYIMAIFISLEEDGA